MTDQVILGKAITKAIAGGWNIQDIAWLYRDSAGDWLFINDGSLEKLIFNHDFAKALWGNENKEFRALEMWLKAWQHHLQQMVIDPNPIEYLGAHLDD